MGLLMIYNFLYSIYTLSFRFGASVGRKLSISFHWFQSPLPVRDHRTLPRRCGWCLRPDFYHFDTICKEPSELKIFLFDSEAKMLSASRQWADWVWQTVRSVSFSWSTGCWRTVRTEAFPEEWAVMNSKKLLYGEMVLFGANLHGV